MHPLKSNQKYEKKVSYRPVLDCCQVFSHRQGCHKHWDLIRFTHGSDIQLHKDIKSRITNNNSKLEECL